MDGKNSATLLGEEELSKEEKEAGQECPAEEAITPFAADVDGGPSLSEFGEFGRYSLLVILLCQLMLLPQMGNMTLMVYAGAAPRLLSCGNISLADHVDPCAELKRIGQWQPCPGPIQVDAQFDSLALEFGYFCEETFHIKRCISVLMFGVLCGSLIFGQLSDWFGRKRILLLAHFGILVLDFAASLSDSLFQFTALQFLTMLLVGGHNSIMHVFLLENLPKRHRLWVMNVISYSPNYVLFAGIAYLAADWRTLLRVLSLLNLPPLAGLLLAFESPRWLFHKGQLDRARRVLLRVEAINRTDTVERMAHLERALAREEKLASAAGGCPPGLGPGRNCHYLDLFSSRPLCSFSLVLSFALLSISTVSWTFVFNMDSLSGSLFLNAALFGFCRYVLNLAVGGIDFFSPRAGRRQIYSASICLILTALGLLFAAKLAGWEGPLLMRAAMIFAASLCAQLYMLTHVMTAELFPTAVRNIAASFVQIANRMGVVISPHLFHLAFFWPPLPFLLMILLLALNLALFLVFIPETKNQPLAENMPSKEGHVGNRDGSEAAGIPLVAVVGNGKQKEQDRE